MHRVANALNRVFEGKTVTKVDVNNPLRPVFHFKDGTNVELCLVDLDDGKAIIPSNYRNWIEGHTDNDPATGYKTHWSLNGGCWTP